MNEQNEAALESDLSALIGKHAEWLDGATFMAVCRRVAFGYFDARELDAAEDERLAALSDAAGAELLAGLAAGLDEPVQGSTPTVGPR